MGVSVLKRFNSISLICIAILSLGQASFAASGVWDEIHKQVQKAFKQENLEQAEKLIREELQQAEGPKGTKQNLFQSYFDLGSVQTLQKQYPKAGSSLRQALKLQEDINGPDSDALLDTLLLLASVYHIERKFSDGEPLYRRIIQITEKNRGTDHLDIAERLTSLGINLQFQEKYAEAEPVFKRALTIQEAHLGKDNPALATNLESLASISDHYKRWKDAEDLERRALALNEKAPTPDFMNIGSNLMQLGWYAEMQNNFADARTFYERAMMASQKAPAENNWVYDAAKEHQEMLSKRQANLEAQKAFDANSALNAKIVAALSEAKADVSKGKYDSAEKTMRSTLAQIDGRSPEHAALGTCLASLGQIVLLQGKVQEAESLLSRGLKIIDKKLPDDQDFKLSVLNALAVVYARENKPANVVPLYKRVYDALVKRFGAMDPKTVVARRNLAKLYLTQGQSQKAEALFNKENIRELNDILAWRKHMESAMISLKVGRWAEAEKALLPALQIAERIDPKGEEMAATLFGLGRTSVARKDYVAAMKYLKRDLTLLEAAEDGQMQVADCLDLLSQCYIAQKQPGLAKAALVKSAAIKKKQLPVNHPDLAMIKLGFMVVGGSLIQFMDGPTVPPKK
jgi:tetratricopeptide (TPR) repeat protein